MLNDFGVPQLLGVCARLSALIVWAFIAIAHLLLLDVLIALFWWFQVTPEVFSTAFLHMLESKPAALAGLIGVSLLGTAGLYWKLVRWAHKASGSGWLFQYVMQRK